MPPPPDSVFVAWLQDLLAEDPLTLAWPREFRLDLARREVPGLFDPHNALLVLYGAQPRELTPPAMRPILAVGREAPDLCTRVLVYARGGDDAAWPRLGFRSEGVVPGFWSDGAEATVWARVWGSRSIAPRHWKVAVTPARPAPLPLGWTERMADPDDAPAIRALLAEVFPAYPIPTDPGTIRYALAGGLVRGRVVVTEEGELAAYASAEFQPGGGAPEITDCATAPVRRGRGLMAHLVSGLLVDLRHHHDQDHAYALAREDRPAMARVLARAGWRHTGRLVNHYRVGKDWVTAGIWSAEPGSGCVGLG